MNDQETKTNISNDLLLDNIKLYKLGDNCECYTDENYFYVDKNCTLQCLTDHLEKNNDNKLLKIKQLIDKIYENKKM